MDGILVNNFTFEEFLRRNHLVPPEKAKFYAFWVKRFLNYLKHRPSKPLDQIIASYLEAMETDPRFADWQVKQAADAILLYTEKYLKSEKPPFPMSTTNPKELKSYSLRSGQNLDNWKEIFNRFHKNMRLRHYSPRTEKSYRIWINKFRKHMNNRDPQTLEGKDVKEFLTHIALRERVSASTQNQAFNALLFLFRNILQKNLSDLSDTVRARQKRRLPVVLTRQEVKQLFSYLNGTYLLMAQLLYGSGLRLLECIRLRVKDIDFANNLLMIRSGKGEKDRTTVLPEKLKEPLTLHLQRIKQIYDQDLENGYGETTLPDALEKKYPNANKEWAWQWVFPSKNLVVHPVDGRVKRHHIQPSTLQRISRSRKQRFTAHLAQARVLATLSTEFSASAFIQYNSAVDTAIANIRLRFNPREGNDLYLVYNEELNTDRSREIPRLPFSSGRTILIKYSYTFNY